MNRLSIHGLLPNTSSYMTYDGSTTMPGCHETVTWIVFNKPIYITKQQVEPKSSFKEGASRFLEQAVAVEISIKITLKTKLCRYRQRLVSI